MTEALVAALATIDQSEPAILVEIVEALGSTPREAGALMLVTGDSIAMLSEACATGRPVQIFDVGGMRGDTESIADFRVGGMLYGLLMRWLWEPLSRDITLVHRQLRATSRAFWLDEEFGASVVPGESDMQRAVAAVRGLLGEG